MKAVSISEARKRFKELAELAEKGEATAITHYSRVVAILSPPPSKGMIAKNRKNGKNQDA